MHIHVCSAYFTCHGQFVTHLRARAHTHTRAHSQWTTKANEQECPQISGRARQLPLQGGVPPAGRLLSAANGAPQSDNGMPSVSRHWRVNTVAGGGGGTLSPSLVAPFFSFSLILLILNCSVEKPLQTIIDAAHNTGTEYQCATSMDMQSNGS